MTEQRIWPTDSGPVDGVGDTSSANMGVEFIVTEAVWVTHLRHWRAASGTSSAPDRARLYRVLTTTTGSLLADVSSGITSVPNSWNEVALATPVLLTANLAYKAVFHFPAAGGNYTATGGYWATGGPGESGITNGVLFAPDGTGTTGAGQGTYIYSNAPTFSFPYNQFNSTNYWIDLVTTDVDPTVPRVSAGPDSFIIKGDTFSTTAVETLLGVTPTAREWKIISGPADADTILSTTTDVSYTPPLVVGEYILQYTATGTGGPFISTMRLEVMDPGHKLAMRSMGLGVSRW